MKKANDGANIRFCEIVRTAQHKSGDFQKRSSKWIFIKREVCENAVDQCEHAKMGKNKTAATATTLHQLEPKRGPEKMVQERSFIFQLRNLEGATNCAKFMV